MAFVKVLGRQQSVGITKEVTRGTSPAQPTYTIPFDEAAIEEKDSKVVQDQAYGVVEDSTGEDITRQWAEGTVKAPATDQSLPLLLLSALGTDTPAAEIAPNALAYDHVLTVGQTVQQPSLSIYLNDVSAAAGAQDYAHANGVVNKLELDYELGKPVIYSATLLAKKGIQQAVTPAVTTENRFLSQDVVVKLAATAAGLTAASALAISSLKLTIDRKAESDPVLGDIGPNDYLSKGLSIDGTLEATWDSEASFKTAALAGTTQAMRIDMLNSRVTIATSAHPEIKIDLNKVTFEEITKPWKAGEIVKQQLKFKAHYNVTDSKMITVTCTNLLATL